MKGLQLAEEKRKDDLSSWDGVKAFDMYEPEWVCELDTRVGSEVVSVGDGPKFVCAPEALQDHDCIVYSIGSAYNFKFEEGMYNHAPNCEFHVFDGTMDLTKIPLPDGLEQKNIHFHNWNVGVQSYGNKQRYQTKGIRDILSDLGHIGKTIQVFKIDCERCEFSVLPFVAQLIEEGAVNIGQIQVEVHSTRAREIEGLFQSLRKSRFMIFHKERNHWGCSGYKCVEYSLISYEMASSVFIRDHCPNSHQLNDSRNTQVNRII